MRLIIAALLFSISVPAFADNIADCEVVLMEQIKQEDSEGVTEIASFRPAADFIASVYDDETEVIREIDGLSIRALMCKRRSVVPSETDFPIIATGTPFMISQNFDSNETGLTTIYFKNGAFRSTYNGPDLLAETNAEMTARLAAFNARSHNLAAKEKAMLEKSTDEALPRDDITPESADKDEAPMKQRMEIISHEEHEKLK